MSDSFKICAIGIVFAMVCVLIKNYRGEFLIPTRLASIIIIFGAVTLLVSPVIKFINSIMGQTISLEYMEEFEDAMWAPDVQDKPIEGKDYYYGDCGEFEFKWVA